MNTPSHAIFNLGVLDRRGREEMVAPILLGAVLPVAVALFRRHPSGRGHALTGGLVAFYMLGWMYVVVVWG